MKVESRDLLQNILIPLLEDIEKIVCVSLIVFYKIESLRDLLQSLREDFFKGWRGAVFGEFLRQEIFKYSLARLVV